MSLVETEIGTIAPDWKVVLLKDVAEKPQYGLTAKAAKSGDTQFLRITDITDQGVNWATVPFCSAPKKKIDTCRLKSGDIVFARIGATTGKSYMITNPPNAVFASYLIRVRAGEDLEPGFLIQFFQSRGYWQQVDANKHANLKKGVNGSILSELVLPLPPLSEQQKIAHILSTVQRAIEAQERIIQTTTELKKALMHKLFIDGLRNEPQKQTEIGLVPESWEVAALGDMLTIAQYGLSVKGNPDGHWPILRMTNQVDGQIVSRDLQYVEISDVDAAKYQVESGDILFNRTNSFDLVGRTAVFDIEGDFVFASYLIRLRTDNDQLDSFFLNAYFNMDETQARLKSIATRAVSQSNISATRLKGFPIPKPSLDEQRAIVARGNVLDRKIAVHRSKREQLEDLFRTLLHELMTAKLRVHDLELPFEDRAA